MVVSTTVVWSHYRQNRYLGTLWKIYSESPLQCKWGGEGDGQAGGQGQEDGDCQESPPGEGELGSGSLAVGPPLLSIVSVQIVNPFDSTGYNDTT